jgi:hypothetical protein
MTEAHLVVGLDEARHEYAVADASDQLGASAQLGGGYGLVGSFAAGIDMKVGA